MNDELIRILIRQIERDMSKHKLEDSLTKEEVERICKELGLSTERLISILFFMILRFSYFVRQKIGENMDLKEKLKYSEKVADSIKNDKKLQIETEKRRRTYNQKMIAAGYSIARRKSGDGSLFDVYYAIMNGWSDAKIMEEYHLSRSTLWRRKKELEKRKREGATYIDDIDFNF